MAYNKVVSCIFLFIVIMCFEYTHAKPVDGTLQREKRTSDQRLAELETLIALARMKGKLITIPVGFGQVDPAKIGRRRRSVAKLLRSLVDDNSSEEQNTIEDQIDRDKSQEQNLLLNLLYEELPNKYRTIPAE